MIVVILSYNHPDLTDRCVRSALEHAAASRVVLIHNGSEEKWIKQHRKNWPELEHLVLSTNRGFSGGANAGLCYAFEKAEWVLFLTNDCKLLTTSQKPSAPGLYAPLIWARKVGRVDSLGGALNLEKAHLRHLKTIENEDTSLSARTAEHFYVPGTAFWMHKDFFTATQGFNEQLGTYWEDVELCLRAKQLKLHLGIHQPTEILHGIGKTCHSDSHYTTYLFQRNRKRVCLAFATELRTKTQLCFWLSLSWLNMALKKIRRKQWQGLLKLAIAIVD